MPLGLRLIPFNTNAGWPSGRNAASQAIGSELPLLGAVGPYSPLRGTLISTGGFGPKSQTTLDGGRSTKLSAKHGSRGALVLCMGYQYFLKELNNIPTFVFLYFVNADDMLGPTSEQEWIRCLSRYGVPAERDPNNHVER